MTDLSAVKRRFAECGQLHDRVLGREVALSWYKCKLLGLSIDDTPQGRPPDVAADPFAEYCDRIVPPSISYIVSDAEGRTIGLRNLYPELAGVTSVLEELVGTNGGALALHHRKNFLVTRGEHYLEALAGYSSRGIYLGDERPLLTLFYAGNEDGYAYRRVLSEIDRFAGRILETGGTSSDAPDIGIYLDPYYDLPRLDLEVQRRIPLSLPILITGPDSRALAWYLAECRRQPAAVFDSRGIPAGKLEEKFLELLERFDSVIVTDFENCPPELERAISRIIDDLGRQQGGAVRNSPFDGESLAARSAKRRTPRILLTNERRPPETAFYNKVKLFELRMADYIRIIVPEY